MSRLPRKLVGDCGIFHIYNRGNNKKQVFHDDSDFVRFRNIVAEAKRKFGLKIYYYAWMPNHYHLLVEFGSLDSLSSAMKAINQSYSNWHKNKYGGIGHLWQDRFNSKPISNDTHFATCAHYIETNPVKGGLCRRPEEYPWSSYRFHTLGRRDVLVDRDFIYLSLGRSHKDRRKAHQENTASYSRILGI